jgi:hypothetical protein
MLEGKEIASPLAKAVAFTKPKVRKILVLGSGGLSIGISRFLFLQVYSI